MLLAAIICLSKKLEFSEMSFLMIKITMVIPITHEKDTEMNIPSKLP